MKIEVAELRQVTTDPTGRWVRCDKTVLAALLDAIEVARTAAADFGNNVSIDHDDGYLDDYLASRFDFGDADA